MQLLLLLFALLSGSGTKMKELKPLLEEIGGKEAAAAVQQAEQLTSVLSAFQSMSQAGNGAFGGAADSGSFVAPEPAGNGYPLSPIATIADEKITYALSRYIAETS